MMKRLNKILEVVSPEALDTLMKYSKTSPEYMLDDFRNNLRKTGIESDLDKVDNDFFYLTLSNKNGIIKKTRLSKKDLVTGEINIDNIF